MTNELESKLQELDKIKAHIEKLENEIAAAQRGPGWRATSYYGAYYATAGSVLGILGALASLAVNLRHAADPTDALAHDCLTRARTRCS